MKTTINYMPILNALSGIKAHLDNSPLEHSLIELVNFRVSQINGCAFCLDMHAKELLQEGESAQRLFVLNAWREAPFYSDRERAALAFAEALTTVAEEHVPASVKAEAAQHFSETELLDLALNIIAINSYNRLNIAFGSPLPVGSYKVGMFAAKHETI